MTQQQTTPSKLAIIAAFAAIYFIWGSTYVAIRFALETLPGFLMGGLRFLTAGGMLYAWARWKGAERPGLAEWKTAAIVGGLLLFVGNGGVVFAEHTVPSSLVALLVATLPLWIALLEWFGRGVRPGLGEVLGILGGMVGIVLLVGPGELAGGKRIDPLGAAVVTLASIAWAMGSLYSRHAKKSASPVLGTAMQMLAGGTMLTALGSVTGEWAQVDVATISARSMLSLAYLVIFGSMVAFTAYTWLLRVSTPAKVSTYAYVNPVVAVFLGWALAGEPVTARTLIAAAVIIGAVAITTTWKAQVTPAAVASPVVASVAVSPVQAPLSDAPDSPAPRAR